MVFDRIINFFSNLFTGPMVSVGKPKISIWMPEFIEDVEDNTKKLLQIAARLRMLAKIIRLARIG